MMLGQEFGGSVGLLAASGALSFVGALLALCILPREATGMRARQIMMNGRWAVASRVVLSGLLLTGTAWLLFLLALKLHFPRLDPDIPRQAMLRSWAMVAVGAVAALGIAARMRRSVRNVAFAGSVMASSMSCMVFASMSGIAAPSALAYDLTSVIATMAAGSMLWAGGLWLHGRPGSARIVPGLLMAASLTLVAVASLSCILPFSEWKMAAATPGAIAFRPVTVIFLSELGVTLILGFAGAGVDRQAAAQVARENERLRQLTESTFEALLIHDGGVVLDANSAFCELIGRPLSAIKGQPIESFLPGGDRISAISSITRKPEAFETQIAAANGEALPVEVLSRDVQFAGGPARVTALRDIRERRAAEARIRFLAQHDTLTGLPNRAQFQEAINRQLALSKRDGIPLAVMCIDLDRFKHVNDTLGHWAGDLILKQVAERLLGTVRETDTVARIGGDEFVLLQTGASQPESSGVLAARIIEVLSEPFDLNGNHMTIGASVGIALSPQDSTLADVLVQDADIALYRAKSNERGTFCFFKAGMDTLLKERRELEQDIIRATASGGFQLAFQPLFSGANPDQAVGFEALLRWRHPARGMISPDQFIPLAEETGLIVPLGAWVLEAACREAASWPSQYRVAVNVSPRQFTGGDFPSLVAGVLRRTGLPAGRLEIEITETLLIKDGEAALGILRRLKQSGVRIALDDFGTGYSSLSYLQRFPFDKVKIDQSFVRTLSSSEDARAIVGAILAMGHQLRLEVTAEGVETLEQLAFLRSQQCDQVQGFLLSRPLPQENVRDYILRTQARPATEAAEPELTAA
jgi:diguanylate cyclase (GGDEF)-like protein/PAS domain S-box-containing protein